MEVHGAVWSVRGVPVQGQQTGRGLPCIVMGLGNTEVYLLPYQAKLHLHPY